MTNKEIYEKVLDIVDIPGCRIFGVCTLIHSVCGHLYDESSFPEWAEQKPKNYTQNDEAIMRGDTHSLYWWPIEDRENRKEALKRAIALCP